MTKINLTKFNTQKIALNVEMDFHEAQRLLDLGEENIFKINASDAYEVRVKNSFVGTYPIKVERNDDYKRFNRMMKNEKCYRAKQAELREKWYNNELEYDVMQEQLDALRDCTCPKCNLENLTFEQWKSGIIEETVYIENPHYTGFKTKQIRVNKALQRAGFSKELLDFYATQVKTEKFVYVTISDRPQHIVGMSAYAELNNWGSGYRGSSCQDPRHDDDLAFDLSGSLHDDKILVAYLHAELEDLEDMQDKLLARCTMRITSFNDELFAIGNKCYGLTENKDLLKKALDALNERLIYSENIHDTDNAMDELVRHEEDANGAYRLIYTNYEEIYINETIEETVTCDCPMCHGSGKHEVRLSNWDEVEIDCPLCHGSGEYETYIYEEVEAYEEVENEEDLGRWTGYDGEGFSHYRSYTVQYLNKTKLEEDAIKYGRKLV